MTPLLFTRGSVFAQFSLKVAALVLLSCGVAVGTLCSSNFCETEGNEDPGTLFLQVDHQMTSSVASHIEPRQSFASQYVQLKGEPALRSAGGMRAQSFNIVYVRIPKTASTTGCGVSRRIAAHTGLNGVFDRRAWANEFGVVNASLITWVSEPFVFAEHGALDSDHFGAEELEAACYPDNLPSMKAIGALKLPTFLWTVFRDPAKKTMSNLYYASRGHENQLNTAVKLSYLNTVTPNVMYRYTRPFVEATLDDIFSTYGLVGVLERFDETLVVLAASLKLPLSYMLYLPSKEDGVKNEENVTIIKHPSIDAEPQVVQDLLDSKFRPENEMDYQLLARANEILDGKIAQMKLEPAIKEFKDLLATAQKDCDVPGQDRAPIATLTKCYYSDHGCNYECFDKYDAASRASCTWCD